MLHFWRDIEPPALHLAELHHVLQAAYGWRDEHLHEFIIGGLAYGAPELADEAAAEDNHRRSRPPTSISATSTSTTCPTCDSSITTTSATDGCTSSRFEQRITKDTGLKYPACVDGARHRPPEDVGGTSGYAQFLEAWSDPTHEEHKAMRQWVGRAFHPEKFDLQAADKAVKTAYRRARGDYLFRRQ